MKYILLQDGQHYVESNTAFELRENGTPGNLTWHIYFNGAKIGYCHPAAVGEASPLENRGPYTIHTAKQQLVGQFDSYIEGCKALQQLATPPTLPPTEPSAVNTPTQTLNATQIYGSFLNLLKDLEAFVDVQDLKLSFDRSHRAYLSGRDFEEEIVANFSLHREVRSAMQAIIAKHVPRIPLVHEVSPKETRS